MITIELTEDEVGMLKAMLGRPCDPAKQNILRKIEPKTYQVGQRFRLSDPESLFNGDTFVLTIKKPEMEINFFNESSSELWSGRNIRVNDPREITEDEVQTLTGERNFEEI